MPGMQEIEQIMQVHFRPLLHSHPLEISHVPRPSGGEEVPSPAVGRHYKATWQAVWGYSPITGKWRIGSTILVFTWLPRHLVIICLPRWILAFPGGTMVKNLPASEEDAREVGSIPGSGRSPGVGSGNQLQYSWLKIPWTEEPGGLQFLGLQKSWRTEWLSLTRPWIFLLSFFCRSFSPQAFSTRFPGLILLHSLLFVYIPFSWLCRLRALCTKDTPLSLLASSELHIHVPFWISNRHLKLSMPF